MWSRASPRMPSEAAKSPGFWKTQAAVGAVQDVVDVATQGDAVWSSHTEKVHRGASGGSREKGPDTFSFPPFSFPRAGRGSECRGQANRSGRVVAEWVVQARRQDVHGATARFGRQRRGRYLARVLRHEVVGVGWRGGAGRTGGLSATAREAVEAEGQPSCSSRGSLGRGPAPWGFRNERPPPTTEAPGNDSKSLGKKRDSNCSRATETCGLGGTGFRWRGRFLMGVSFTRRSLRGAHDTRNVRTGSLQAGRNAFARKNAFL
jgi:hypothetical protein